MTTSAPEAPASELAPKVAPEAAPEPAREVASEAAREVASEPAREVGAPGARESASALAEPLPAVHARPWAVGVYLAFTALVGLAWSAPLAAAMGRVTRSYPRGDAELFDPGAVMLVEAARRVLASLSTIAAAWAVVAVVALPLGFVVLAFVLAQLAARRPSGPRLALARAIRAMPALIVIGLLAPLVSAALAALLMMGGGEISRSTWPVPPQRDLARLGLFAVVTVVVLAVGVVHDLARAAAVSGPSRAHAALRAAFRIAARSPGRVAWAYSWRAVLALACVVAAAWLAVLVGNRSTGALVASAFVHQLGLAAAGWLRLAWLATALKLVQPALRRGGRPPALGAT